MTTEIWRVHILWIFQITKITRAKSPIQNCLRGGFQERVGITDLLLCNTHYPVMCKIQAVAGGFAVQIFIF